MASAKKPGGEPDLNFDELFAEEQQQPAAKGEPGKENLQELEAFLDDFEKNLGEPGAPAPAAAPVAAAPAAEPSFTEPHEAEELVHGLLKEDELNLDVQGADKAPAVPEPAEFEPQPLKAPALDIPAFIHAAPAAGVKPVPAAAAGFSRIGFILALVLGGVALLVAIGAGWMALNATQAVQGLQMSGGGGTGQDTRITRIQSDVAALNKRVDDLSKNLEGSMNDLHSRVAALEKATGGAAPAAGTAEAAPQGTRAEPPKAGVTAAAPEAQKGTPAKPAAPVAEAPKPQPATPAGSAAPKSPAPAASAVPPSPTRSPAPAPSAPQGTKPAAAVPPTPAPQAQETAPATAPQAATPPAQGAAPAAPKNGTPAASAAKTKPAPVVKKGDWVVHLTSSDEKRRAQAQLAHARARGLDARLTTGVVEGQTWYRVTVEGFATADAARAYVAAQAQAAGFSTAWIAKR